MADRNNFQYLIDPLKLKDVLWPHVRFYSRQREIIYSVWDNDETDVVAGNMLGKDYVTAFIVLAFFLTRSPCRVVTTSVDATQLEGVLWGEIRRFIQEAKYPLSHTDGGPLLINHLHLRKVFTNGPRKGELCPTSYCIGRVAAKGEGMLGHHVAETGDGVPRTLFVADEASGVDDGNWEVTDSWARRKIAIGNPYPCSNFFYRAVEGGAKPDGSAIDPGGNVPRPEADPRGGFYRNVIHVKAEDSPNVALALAQQQAGLPVTGEVVIPGVLPWGDYVKREATWDPVRKCIGLRGRFWKGADLLLYPPHWLDRAELFSDLLAAAGVRRRAEGMGVDPAEGGDKSAWTVVDRYGVMFHAAMKTPKTTTVRTTTMALMREFDLRPEQVVFDRGGGGKEHADSMDADFGLPVRTVGFGAPVSEDPKRGVTTTAKRLGLAEDRYASKDMKALMYSRVRHLIDPSREDTADARRRLRARIGGGLEDADDRVDVILRGVAGLAGALSGPDGRDMEQLWKDEERGGDERPDFLSAFVIPREYHELRRQMSLIPLTYTPEGRLYVIPKDRPNKQIDYKGPTLRKLLGCSPDELDSLVLAVHAMVDRPKRAEAGAL